MGAIVEYGQCLEFGEERVRIIDHEAQSSGLHFMFILKLHVNLDVVASKARVVVIVIEEEPETEQIGVKCDSFGEIACAQDWLDLK